MNDGNTYLGELREMIARFVQERDWQKFHSPKNLAMSLAIEAAELMEHFQWLTPEQSREIASQPETLEMAGEEMADVLCYLLALANELQMDLSAAVRAKLIKNGQKYPVDQIRGRWGHNDPAGAE